MVRDKLLLFPFVSISLTKGKTPVHFPGLLGELNKIPRESIQTIGLERRDPRCYFLFQLIVLKSTVKNTHIREHLVKTVTWNISLSGDYCLFIAQMDSKFIITGKYWSPESDVLNQAHHAQRPSKKSLKSINANDCDTTA